nr:hypothetical protein [Cellvibrionaceae bacterium]
MLGSSENQEEIQKALVDGTTRIKRFVKKFSLNPQDEADCIQESIARVLEQSRKKSVRNPVAYAMSVAKNIVFKSANQSAVSVGGEEGRSSP